MLAVYLAYLADLDRHLFAVVNGSGAGAAIDALMELLSSRRAGLVLAAVVFTVVMRLSGRRWIEACLLSVAAALLSNVSVDLLKLAVQRVRPCHVLAPVRLLAGCTGSFAFPSSHATNMAAVAAVAWAVRAPWRVAAAGLAIGVGVSRVYLGVHYPGDVVAGFLVGGVVGWAVARRGTLLVAQVSAASLALRRAAHRQESPRFSRPDEPAAQPVRPRVR